MSNQVVGSVYQQIIEKVISASLNDFEEFGVDQSTLDEMKQGWQDKLTALHVASFPWDPQPEPPRQPPTVPSNVKTEPDVSPAVSAPHQEHVNFPNVAIKTERAYDQPLSSYPSVPVNGYSGGFNGDLAQQRAQVLVAQRMNQSQHTMQMPPQQHGQVPMHGQQRMMPNQGQQRPSQQMPRPQQPGPVFTSQTDGPHDDLADWNAIMEAKAAEGDDGRVAADELMRTRIDAMNANQDMGLGMTLDEMPKGKKRKAITRVRQQQLVEASSSSSEPHAAPFDGGEEEEESKENPEDAINSDLDDPEDDLDAVDNSDDETQQDYMLCTYDKVQRVKNKWKCVLKDGILTTNKKEYLFHKATGDFEW